jgi:RNA polymerase sigma-70 factor (ECF subfamily)
LDRRWRGSTVAELPAITYTDWIEFGRDFFHAQFKWGCVLAVSESTTKINYESLDPDVRLMLQVRDDNAAAFEELVQRYQGRLLTVLEHMVGKRIGAEDLAQEVFLRVYRARKNYTPGAKFSTWLFTIANNVARNALRTVARRKEVHIEGDGSGPQAAANLENLALESSGLMPARRLDKEERAEAVRQALSMLNERQRMATVLSKFEGMSYEEIADAMELSVQAVKSLLSRARCNLRATLEPYIVEGARPRPSNGALEENYPPEGHSHEDEPDEDPER